MARKDSYEELINQSLKLIESMLVDGHTEKEIADKIGVSYSTYRKYKSNSVALKGIIATAKDKKRQNTEKALYKSCIGYHYYEEVAFKCKTEEVGEDGQILVKEDVKVTNVKKYKGPDLNSIKYYLNNRESARWKDDPHKVELGKKSLKIKEKLADKEDW